MAQLHRLSCLVSVVLVLRLVCHINREHGSVAEAGGKLGSAALFACFCIFIWVLTLWPWRWRQYVPRNIRLHPNYTLPQLAAIPWYRLGNLKSKIIEILFQGEGIDSEWSLEMKQSYGFRKRAEWASVVCLNVNPNICMEEIRMPSMDTLDFQLGRSQ